ncbi:MAG: N-acetyltransferase [Elusimicrobiota bacterium]|jgi:amino-acid N-acetyltransferase|nr:N-acetyltransferase [Elusimicrobiota bacterium]
MIRKANLNDAKKIQKLINSYADNKVMLPRSLNHLYEHIREFMVYVDDNDEIKGCCAAHIFWNDLAEIKALAVDKDYLKKGAGKQLVEACIQDVKSLGIKKVFALTYVDKFFSKIGFNQINRDNLPQKIWQECIHCPKFPECDEIAVIKNIE